MGLFDKFRSVFPPPAATSVRPTAAARHTQASGPRPPASIAALLAPRPSFDARFKAGDTFPNATWETQWRDWGQGAVARRSQYGVSLAIYADRSIGIDPFVAHDGMVEIVTNRISGPPPLGWKGGYSTGMLTTSSSFRQKYGYFEVDVFAPMARGKAMGLWPTCWLISDDTGQELDLMEVYGSNISVINQTVHGAGVARGTWTRHGDPTARFTKVGALWRPSGYVQFYVDGKPTSRENVKDLGWTAEMFFIVSNAVGVGPPKISPGMGPPNGSTRFPASMFVRGVRAWRMR